MKCDRLYLERYKLVSLLSSPLLLDIFLRVFSLNEHILSQPQTHYGVLKYYWDKIIVPDQHSETLCRQQFLDKVACAELNSQTHKLPQGQELSVLRTMVSEGLFVLEGSRYFRFRHPLLRDFALMSFVIDQAMHINSVDSVIQFVSGFKRPIVAYGVIRACIEACCDKSFMNELRKHHDSGLVLSVENLLSACADEPGLLSLFAEIFGEIDEPELVLPFNSIAATLNKISPTNSDFGSLWLRSARLSQKAVWISYWKQIPMDSSWVQEQNWLGPSFIIEICTLLEVTWRKLTSQGVSFEVSDFQEIAKRVRLWSGCQLFFEHLQNHPWLWRQIIKTVSFFDPSMEALRWLERLRFFENKDGSLIRIKDAVIDALPIFAHNTNLDLSSIGSSQFESIYLWALGLRWQERGLVVDTFTQSSSMVSVQGVGSGRGILGLVWQQTWGFFSVAECFAGFRQIFQH